MRRVWLFRRHRLEFEQASEHAGTGGKMSMSEDMKVELNKLLTVACPGWAGGTLVLTSDAGEVVGYGRVERNGDRLTLEASSAPQGVALLDPQRRPSGV